MKKEIITLYTGSTRNVTVINLREQSVVFSELLHHIL